jgi:hypothetical protein
MTPYGQLPTTYIKLATKEYPRYEGDIRLDHPDIPEGLTGATFPVPDTYSVIEIDVSGVDSETQVYSLGSAIFESGVWRAEIIVSEADWPAETQTP